MSGPVSPPLATTESGTTVRVQPTNTLEFNGADFTVTQSGSKASIAIDSTGTGAALTATQVGFGDSSNLLTGSTSLTFDDTNKKLTITGDADNDSVLEIIGSDSAAGAGPRLTITNDTGTDSALDLTMDNFAVGILRGGTPGGTMREVMRFGQMSSDNYTVTFNEGGLAADFRIEGETNQNLFFVDGGQDNVGIGTAPDSNVEGLHVKGTGTGTLVRLESTDDGATQAPNLQFYRNSGTPAVSDQIGSIQFTANDDGGAQSNIGKIYCYIEDETALTENGVIILQVAEAGSLRNNLVIGSTLVTVNSSQRNVDFQVLSDDGTRNIYSDAGLNAVGMGTVPDSGVERLHVKGIGVSTMVRIESTDGGGSGAPDLDLYRNSASPATGDDLGTILFSGNDSAGAKVNYFQIKGEIRDPASTSDDGELIFIGPSNSTDVEFLRLSRTVGVVVNETGSGVVDFRVEGSTNDNLISTDAGLDKVGFGAAPASGAALVQIDVGDSTTRALDLISRDADASAAPTLRLNRISSSPAVSDATGKISFAAEDSSSNSTDYATIESYINDPTDGAEDGDIRFKTVVNGSLVEFLRANQFGVIFNELGIDQNFKVESNNNPTMFRIDGGLDVCAVGRSGTSGGAEFQVENGASFYRETSNTFTANHDITVEQAHGYVLVMDASSSGANTFTLPDVAAIGMHVKLVNLAGSNGMTVAVAGTTSHQINGAGTAGSSSVSTTTKFQTIECHYVATNVWVATEPAVAA